ncbi:YlmH family RNA-binding protein [Hutsoniella sourekii]
MDHIYQHYRKEEESFVNQVFDWVNQVENTYVAYTTPFLTPREAMIVKQLLANNEDLRLYFDGAYPKAERLRAVISPLYYEVQAKDFQLQSLRINFPSKFADLSHGKILGTLLSTGIDRDRIGDIITDNVDWHLVVDARISDYLIQQVTKISNVGVHLETIDSDQLLLPSETWVEETVIASSMRLDTLVSNVYNFSRQRAKDSIHSGLVKVNFVEVDRPDLEVGLQDIVSLRKFGRFWIVAIEGVTRKDNYRLKINKLESK